MGFANFGRILTEQNRRLKPGQYSRFASNPFATSKNIIGHRKVNNKPTWKEAKKQNIKPIHGVFILLVIPLTILCYHGVLKSFAQSHTNYKVSVGMYSYPQDIEKDLIAFHYLIKSANDHFDNRSYKLAQVDFQLALQLFPNSKDAVYGMTKILAYRCYTENHHCTQALKYKRAVEKSDKYSAEEIQALRVFSPTRNITDISQTRQ